MQIKPVVRAAAMAASIALGAGSAIAATPTDIGTQMHSLSEGVAQVSRSGPGALANYLSQQARQRHLTELFVIDGAGHVLLSVKGPAAPAYTVPDSGAMAGALSGRVVKLAPSGRLESALMKLGMLRDAYLLVVRPS